MKTSLALLFFLLISHLAVSQVNDERSFLLGTYNKAFIISNKIETINITIEVMGQIVMRQYSFDPRGNLVHVVTLDSSGKKKGESFRRYDAYGSKVFQKDIDYHYHTTDSIDYRYEYINDKIVRETSQPPSYSKEYFYNKYGKVEKVVTTNIYDVVTTSLYSYDDQGNEVENIWVQGDTKRITRKTYDSHNNVTEYKEMVYNSSDTAGKLFLHKKYLYGSNGRISKEEFLGGYSDSENDTQEFVYDSDNNLVEQKSKKNQQSFSYDERGFLKRTEKPWFGAWKSIETYSYTIRQ